MRFSDIEIADLSKAWIIISISFAIAWSHVPLPLWTTFIVAALTVGIAFLLHELAHKVIAQRFGCWAEFRAYMPGLFFALISSILIRMVLFVAPGAVLIMGMVTREENGKIAAAGPIVNIILALVMYVGYFLVSNLWLSGMSFNTGLIVREFFQIGYAVNSWLALFNLIPFGPLDGVKVRTWSSSVWLTLIGTAGFMTFFLSPN